MVRRRGPWGAAPEPDALTTAALPDSPEAPPPAPDLGAAASQYPCHSCGAVITYAPGQTVLRCEFCGATTPIPQGDPEALARAVRENDLEAALRGAPSGAEFEVTQVVHCDACGAHVEFDPAEHARECPFCATPIVADTTADRHVKPQALLPFAIRAEEARAGVGKWLAGLWFAPNGLKRYARTGSRLSGLYTPYWTFDAQTETAYAGHRGDAYVVQVRGPDGRPRSQTRIRWSPARGRFRRFFDDVLILGSSSLPQDYVTALAPWDLSKLAPYSRDWLAGFRAEAYTVDLRDAWVAARRQIDGAILSETRRRIGGDQQRVEQVETRVSDVRFKHILLPVWIGAYKYRGKTYRLVVNGRTGAVKGERPWSVWKIALAVAVLLALAGLAAFLFSQDAGALRSFPGGGFEIRLGD